MNDRKPYSRRDWVFAVNLSAMFGWMAVVVPTLLSTSADLAGIIAIFGIPASLLVSWIIVAPILKYIMQNPISWGRAICWGALTAMAVAVVSIVAVRLYGLTVYFDPDSSFQLGGGDYIREIDGILTSYGWLVTGGNTLVFVALGIVVSLLVRFIVGGGKQSNR